MRRELDIFTGFDDLMNLLATGKINVPANVIERTSGYDIELIVPGYRKEDITSSIKDHSLVVKGERQPARDNRYVRQAFVLNSFERRFSLPPNAPLDGISAKCENGVLTISVPFKEKERPLEIKVL